MIPSVDQLAAISADFTDTVATWSDSFCLEPLLTTAHEHGVLRDVWIYQLLDDRDIILISVEVVPATFAHTMPVNWRDIRPDAEKRGVDAIGHVLERLNTLAQAALS
ncbi:hypothetical protein SAMN05216251_11713 [Actinacidiphila alni]|uniref:Uncharacterized protein n=1 Tax=Actinacidiphila alni TaxID=380248 RepID=A0A1I2JBL3_9ACTN|nr:hypothetical protein [Actinacidiphila alni]SFF51370.1 hypothetical protein SAMN05216251_11713 [Actinacidiphila alni]